MVRVDGAFLDAVVQVGHLADGAPRRADPHPVALLDAHASSVLRVDLNTRGRPQFAAPRQLTMLGVEVHRLAGTSGHDERVVVAVLLQVLLVLFHQMIALVVVIDVGVARLDLVGLVLVVVARSFHLGVLRLEPVRELVDIRDLAVVGGAVRAAGFREGLRAVGDVRLGDGGPDLDLGGRGHERALLVDGGVQVVTTLLTTVAHLPAAIRAPTLGMPLAAVEPAFLLELRSVLREVGAVRELFDLPPVGGVLEHAVLLLFVRDVAAHLHEVVVVQVVPLVVLGVAVVPHHAHGLVQADNGNRVVDAVAHRLDSTLTSTEQTAGALGHAAGVDLKPVQDGDDDVGAAVVRTAPQVEVQPEVQASQCFPSLKQVGLVHEVAGHAHAAVNLVRGVDAVDGVPNGCGVSPAVPVAQQREALSGNLLLVALERGLQTRPGTRALVRAALALCNPVRLVVRGHMVAVALGQRGLLVDEVLHKVLNQRDLVLDGQVARGVAQLHGANTVADAPVARLVVGDQHVRAAAAAVDLGLGRTAVAGGLVGVAGDAGDDLQGAGVLHRVARLVGSQLIVDAAVAMQRVQARGVDLHGLDNLLSRNLGHALAVLGRVLGKAVGESFPNGAGLDGGAVLQLDVNAAGEQRGVLRQTHGVGLLAALVALVPVRVVRGVGRVGEVRRVGQPRVGDDGLVGVLDPRTGGRDLVLLALPLAGLGVPVGRLVVVLIPADEAAVAVLLRRRLPPLADPFAVNVGLGQDTGLHVDAAVHLLEPALLRAAVLLRIPQERGVGPTANEQIVVSFVVQNPLEPRQRQAQVGTNTQRQPQVGFLSQRRHARVNQYMLVSALATVYNGTVRGVVVGILSCGAPLHVHERTLLDFHPGRTDFVGQDTGEVARALADLVRQVGVRGREDGLQGAVRGLRPHAGRAAHGEVGFAAVLGNDLVELGASLVKGVGQGNADPTGIVLALGFRALQAVAQTIGMVQCEHRRLRLRAAVAAAVSVGFVALNLDHLVVLDGNPRTALNFTASAAARTDALHFTGRRISTLGQSRGRRCCEPHGCGSTRHSGRLQEAAASQRKFRHMLLLSFSDSFLLRLPHWERGAVPAPCLRLQGGREGGGGGRAGCGYGAAFPMR